MDQGHLFHPDQFKQPTPEADYDPEAWAGRGDISYHSSFERQMPQQSPHAAYGEGVHTGTFPAAVQRGRDSAGGGMAERPYTHPLRMTGEVALRRRESHPALGEETRSGRVWTLTDTEANYEKGEEIISVGQHAPYVNVTEDTGSISYRSPREKLRSWAEDVHADPGASRHHKLLAEQFDLTIPVVENRSTAWKRSHGSLGPQQNLLGETYHPSETLDTHEHALMQPRLLKKPEPE